MSNSLKLTALGFTLIELLAVIIILGVIALITIPLVLRLINGARRDSAVESANSYVKLVKEAILSNSRKVSLKDVVCTITDEGNFVNCNDQILEVNVEGTYPTCGTIIFEDSKLLAYVINMGGYKVVKLGEKGEEESTKTKDCEADLTVTSSKMCVSEKRMGSIELGTQYSCKISDSDNYNFYVLSTNSNGSVNLIMDRNICENTSLSGDNNYCNYPWNSNYQNKKGPIRAMNVLYNATRNWNNIENIEIDYEDEGRLRTGSGYGSIKTENYTTTIYGSDSSTYSIGDKNLPLRARLPKLEELEAAGCTKNSGSCPTWLVTNLKYYNVNNGKYNEVNNGKNNWNIQGYWTLASNDTAGGIFAYTASYTGNISFGHTGDYIYGIRPVITVPRSELK